MLTRHMSTAREVLCAAWHKTCRTIATAQRSGEAGISTDGKASGRLGVQNAEAGLPFNPDNSAHDTSCMYNTRRQTPQKLRST